MHLSERIQCAHGTCYRRHPAKRICLEDSRNGHSSLPWLTESWLAKVVRYERIATASPRLGVGVIGHSLLDHHINLLPNITGLQDFTPVVREGNSGQLEYRVKTITWPMSKHDELKVKEFAA